MSYHLVSRMPEFPPGHIPPEYPWRAKEVLASTGWKGGQLTSYCERIKYNLPHVVERRGLQTTRYFNPQQIAQWMKEEAERRSAS